MADPVRGEVAVIPARGGSKRIPGKNIRPFQGLPMIAHPIRAALASGLFRRVIVSTDDPEIARVAVAHGAEAPFTRPAEIADDKTGVLPVMRHAIAFLRDTLGESPAAACLIYATAPLIRAEDLVAARRLLDTPGTDSVCAATTFPFPIFRAFAVQPDGTVRYQWPEFRAVNSQDLPETLHDAGQFVWVRTDSLFRDGLITDRTRPLVLPRWRVQDIDTPEDWERAELLHRLLRDTPATPP